jgi:hypothetical protein
VCLEQALNGLAKRVRQLERDNARLKKRQRKHGEAMREIRSLVARHQHTAAAERPHSTDQPGLERKADRCLHAAAIPRQPPVVVSDCVVVQQFPFLRDYDMRGRPFVGADTGYRHITTPPAQHVCTKPQPERDRGREAG